MRHIYITTDSGAHPLVVGLFYTRPRANGRFEVCKRGLEEQGWTVVEDFGEEHHHRERMFPGLPIRLRRVVLRHKRRVRELVLERWAH